jgi:serine/threonine protein kinase
MKKWHIKRLNVADEEAIIRIGLMKRLSSISPLFPELKFVRENDSIIQYSCPIINQEWPEDNYIMKQHWEEFKREIYKMHDLGYVHGDILKKNILYDGQRLRLIDHELKLSSGNCLRATFPWIAIDDYVSRQVTVKTDILCLQATEFRLFDDIRYRKLRVEQTEILHSCIYHSKNRKHE